MEINVLITSVSKKVWLVETFKNALAQAEGVSGKVVSADSDPLSAGFYKSDKYCIVPYSDEPDFIPEILSICKKEKIRLIVPTRDGELLVFAKNKSRFKEQGIEVMVSDPEIIGICNDKYRFYEFMQENNILIPKTMLLSRIDFCSLKYPLMVKEREGSGSKALYKVENEQELKFSSTRISCPVIQEFLEGKEYTVDLLADFNGRVLTVVPRERVETVAGESYKSRTINNSKLINCAKNVAETLGVIGHITLQFIESGGLLKIIEINPRFGGAAILGIKAGCNTPLLLLKLVGGEKIEPQIGNFKDGLIMLRYTNDLFISDGNLLE